MVSLAFILGGAAAALGGAWGAGVLAWRGRPPSWTLALASGAPLLSLAVFLLLAAGQARGLLLALLCAALIAAGALRKPGLPVWRRPPWWVWPPAAAYALLYAVHALAPEIQPDGAGYHLGLVAEWLREHGFASRVGFYEMLPLGLETLFAPAVAIGGYSAAKLLHLAFLAATLPLILKVADTLAANRAATARERSAGYAAALLYALAPVAGVSGTAAYNDAALVFFIVAAFALLLEDRPGHAGLAAGFCYAIKMTGLVAPAAGLLWLISRRNIHGAVCFGAASLAGIAPWVMRALVQTGNPFAPLLNSVFPNAHFHAATEQTLSGYMRDYGGVAWTDMPRSLTLGGEALQGMIGPAFLLLPLALLALRKPAGRLLLCAAAVLLLPWTINIGARFFLPALPFLALALAMVLPRAALIGVVLAQAVLCWPAALTLYADAGAWRLKGFPWQAALRLRSEADYLRENLWEYRIAEMVSRHVGPRDRMLDLFAAPQAYLPGVPVGSLPSVPFDHMAVTLRDAASPTPEPLDEFECRWETRFLRALRYRLDTALAAPWMIHEIELWYGEHPRPPSRLWFLNAWPVPQDSPLACDHNLATFWQTWQNAPAGAYYEITFHRPLPLDRAVAVMPYLRGGDLRPRVYGLTMDRRWEPLCDAPVVRERGVRSRRRQAIAFLRHQGIRWLLVRGGGDGHGVIGSAIAMAPGAWGVTLVERVNEVCLFRLGD